MATAGRVRVMVGQLQKRELASVVTGAGALLLLSVAIWLQSGSDPVPSAKKAPAVADASHPPAAPSSPLSPLSAVSSTIDPAVATPSATSKPVPAAFTLAQPPRQTTRQEETAAQQPVVQVAVDQIDRLETAQLDAERRRAEGRIRSLTYSRQQFAAYSARDPDATPLLGERLRRLESELAREQARLAAIRGREARLRSGSWRSAQPGGALPEIGG